MKVLLTGGSGLLGSHILKLDKTLIAPDHWYMDITKPSSISAVLNRYKPDVVLHLAAETNPPAHEKDPIPGIRVNILGTAYLALACHKRGIRLVYTSTDYVYTGSGPHTEDEPVKPPSKFVWSKLGGECAVAMLENFLILRIDFGPRPFPWREVYDLQMCSKLYADEMAPLVLKAARSTATGIMNIGGPKISLYDYAKRTNQFIEKIEKPEWVPLDTSLDTNRMKTEL